MALEPEAHFLRRAVRAKLLDADKGTAALFVFCQLQKMGAKFSFGEFLVERGLLSNMGLAALETPENQKVHAVSFVGDFELLELIGEGQNGAVFLARQISLDRVVALKILNSKLAADAEGRNRFLNEARKTARLNHPNVVQGFDVGSDQGLSYFAMEHVDGGSVRDALAAAGGQMCEDDALNLVRQAAEGLKAAHAAGLIHGDLKPDNILLTQLGEVKLADLGISRFIADQGADDGRKEFWGSAAYMAPEVIQGKSHADDGRSDVYSLGVTLFELLAGRTPYVSESTEEVLRMHLQSPIPDIHAFRRDVTIQTASLIKRMLLKMPAERVPSAASVSEAIGRILSLHELPPAPEQSPDRSPARTTTSAHLTQPPLPPPAPQRTAPRGTPGTQHPASGGSQRPAPGRTILNRTPRPLPGGTQRPAPGRSDPGRTGNRPGAPRHKPRGQR